MGSPLWDAFLSHAQFTLNYIFCQKAMIMVNASRLALKLAVKKLYKKVADFKVIVVTTATAELKGEIKMGYDLRLPAWHCIRPFCPINLLFDNLPWL